MNFLRLKSFTEDLYNYAEWNITAYLSGPAEHPSQTGFARRTSVTEGVYSA